MSNPSDFDLSTVPEWARTALNSTPTRAATKSALDYREDSAWPLLLEAALVTTFLPRDLAPAAVEPDERNSAEKVVLDFAETTRTPDGGLRWSLKDETRVEVIKSALDSDALREAIDRTSHQFIDRGSEALRNCLTMKATFTEGLDLNSLEATRIAVGSLSGVSLDLPSIESLDREIELRRLLRVLERMIGRRREGEGTETVERFYGRDGDLESLRSYVGVIPAASIGAGLRRVVNWLTRSISGRAPMAVWGVGGVGKTTLVSKFMLEHAEAAVSRYPFAYLDFDRNTISAGRPSGLLMEMCRQVGAQFEKLTQPMAELRVRVGEAARSFESTAEYEYASFLTSFTHEFRTLVDSFLTDEEKTLEWKRPFLLVFDTFEVVQYASDDIVNLQDFVAGFSLPDENRLWNRLRLIISGRKQILNFLADVEGLELGALDKDGSKEMLKALAGDAKKPITDQEAEDLIAAVAEATDELTGGVQPLRIKLIGNVFEKESQTGSELVESLVKELSEPLESGGLAAEILIDGILVRRVLGHIADLRVRALADPGLVVRRITPSVIKEVMTRGSTDPSVGEPEGADTDPVKPWIVDDNEAQNIFDAFSKEGTLVEPDESISGVEPESGALRHRADVRQQMLPLIRARRPNRFKTVHRLAFDHFLKDVETKIKENKNEMPSASEAIYHGLWLGKPLTEIEALWSKSPGFDPRIDADEFDLGSAPNVYLRAKGGSKLTVKEVSNLPSEITLSWLNQRSADLLDERRIESAIAVIQSAAGEDYSALGDSVSTAAVLARLLYRSGRWEESYQLVSRYLGSASNEQLLSENPSVREPNGKGEAKAASLFSLFRTSLTVEAKSGLPGQASNRVLEIAESIKEPLTCVEVCAHEILASAGGNQSDSAPELKRMIQSTAESVRPNHWKPEQRVLRLAVLTTNELHLFRRWVELRDRVPREVGASHVINMLESILPERRKELQSFHKELLAPRSSRSWNRVDEIWRREKPIILGAFDKGESFNAFWALLVHEHSDWLRPFGNALTRTLAFQDEREALMALLDKNNFWQIKTRKTQGRQHDGIGIVQGAADEGRLLELARLLESWKSNASTTKYPRDVFQIAAALVKWHRNIQERFSPRS